MILGLACLAESSMFTSGFKVQGELKPVENSHPLEEAPPTQSGSQFQMSSFFAALARRGHDAGYLLRFTTLICYGCLQDRSLPLRCTGPWCSVYLNACTTVGRVVAADLHFWWRQPDLRTQLTNLWVIFQKIPKMLFLPEGHAMKGQESTFTVPESTSLIVYQRGASKGQPQICFCPNQTLSRGPSLSGRPQGKIPKLVSHRYWAVQDQNRAAGPTWAKHAVGAKKNTRLLVFTTFVVTSCVFFPFVVAAVVVVVVVQDHNHAVSSSLSHKFALRLPGPLLLCEAASQPNIFAASTGKWSVHGDPTKAWPEEFG